MNTTQPCSAPTPRISFRVFSTIILAAFSVLVTTAHAATITGRVINQGTGDYLKYAQVQIAGTDRSAITEEGGVYTLTDVPAGEVKLAITYTGLDKQEITLAVPAEGTVTQDVSLSTADYGETIKLGTFSISGPREGNAKAIVEQRVALNLKTVVAADAFGDVAEGNVGEFLKLLPGVSVDYVDNDVRATRIRGLPPKYSTTTMDGLPLANSGSNNLSVATGRWLELEQLSMAALDILETTKTPTSDMMSPNLAGNVNALSKSAFSQKGRSIKYQTSVNLNQWNMSLGKSKGWDNADHSKAMAGGKVEWVDTFFDGRLGMVFSVAHSGAYAEQRIVIGAHTRDRNPDNNATEAPVTNSWNFQHGLKPTWRDSVLLNFDFKATEELRLSLRTNYGYYRSEFYNRNWLAQMNTSGLTAYDPVTGVLVPGATPGVINRTEASGESLGSATNSLTRVLGSNQRKSGGTFNISPAASWKRDNLKLDLAGVYSIGKTAYTSGQDGFFSLIQADMQRVGFRYNRVAADNVEITQVSNTGSTAGSIFDIGNYNAAGSVNSERRNGQDQVWAGKGDMEISFPHWKVPSTFKAGVATSLEVRNIDNLQARWTMALTSGPTTGTAINLQDYREGFSGDVGTVTDINGVTGKTPAADKWRLYQLFLNYGNHDPFSLDANGPFRAQAANNLRNLLQNHLDLKERIDAAYVMSTLKPVSALSVVAGLRFEKTKTQGRGFDDIGRFQAATISGTTSTNDLNYIYARYGRSVTREKSYSNALPVLQARYQATKSLIVRGAYYASVLRPDYQNVVGGMNVTDNADGSYSFALNNTALKPETADNLDVSVEYYFEPVGLLSASVFFKNIKDIQINRPATRFSDVPDDIKEQIFNAGYSASDPGIQNPNTNVTTTINGPKTMLWGCELAYSQELSFLPGLLKGLGVTANYSHYEPEEERLWALVPNAGDGMALDQGNLILRYKAGKFKTQIAATWTDKRIVGGGILGMNVDAAGNLTPITTATNSNTTLYQSARWIVSPSMEYQFSRYATVFLNVNNIFNSAHFRYNERDVFTSRHGNYGAAINLGVKGSF